MLTDASHCLESVPKLVDAIHTFNMVCITDKPWIASFEILIPRMFVSNSFESEYYMQLIERIQKMHDPRDYSDKIRNLLL